jgi:hypothetical protein
MTPALMTIAAIYLPAILAIISLICLLRLDRKNRESVLTLQPLGFFGISFPVQSVWIARSLAVVVCVGFAAWYAFYDYSSLFPKNLEMEVFFDPGGLEKILHDSFTPDELRAIGIPESYGVHRQEYLDQLDKEARAVTGGHSFFSAGGTLHSDGETSFVAVKISGWQRYYIQESKGELTNVLEMPHTPEQRFYSSFQKLTTSDDYISASASDLFIRRHIVLHPRFEQFLAQNRTSKGTAFNVDVIGMTKVSVFPWPAFSATVYCAELPEYGVIPFAYAIYK